MLYRMDQLAQRAFLRIMTIMSSAGKAKMGRLSDSRVLLSSQSLCIAMMEKRLIFTFIMFSRSKPELFISFLTRLGVVEDFLAVTSCMEPSMEFQAGSKTFGARRQKIKTS